jgi:hypothetical protein
MTHTASLDANAHLAFTRRSDRPLYEVKSPGLRYFDRTIRFSHLLLLSMCRIAFFLFTEISAEGIVWITQACCRTGKSRAMLKRLKRLGI